MRLTPVGKCGDAPYHWQYRINGSAGSSCSHRGTTLVQTLTKAGIMLEPWITVTTPQTKRMFIR